MWIWGINDLLFALAMAIFSVIIHRAVVWLKDRGAEDEEISASEEKLCQYGILFIRWLGYAAAALSAGTLVLPVLDAMLSALLGTASSLVDKYGGLAIIIGCVVAYWRARHQKPPVVDTGDDDPVEVEYARQEAEELHDDLGELIFNSVVDTSENSPLLRPRDAASIETGREKPYNMDGVMAIHQFAVDTDMPLDKASEALILRELQRHTNQRAKRYKHLCKDGLAAL